MKTSVDKILQAAGYSNLRDKTKWILIAVCGVSLVAMIICSWVGIAPIFWQETIGKANKAHIVDIAPDGSGGRYNPPRYHLVMSYSYQIGPKTYVAEDYLGCEDKLIAESSAKAYLDGKPLTIYYDPNNPSNSTLEHYRLPFLLIVILVLFLGCAAWFWKAWRTQ
jgi:hypothetical protein